MEEPQKVKVLNNCIGKRQSLVGLVEYATDSIVSKTILDSEIGTITLFAFDTEQKLSEHTSPYNAVVQIIDGCGKFIIGGNPLKVSVGEILIMPADIPHSVSAEERFKMLLTMIRT
ncbi:MAG: cupin domain-containing protein [Planctomycetota bacterium]|jgi:quercetin dioxygenase-like cupin family protein